MADEELDELHLVKPEDFTALRTRLAAAAKKRGDATAAKRISATRKPTTAAWIVNRLVLNNRDAKQRLADLGERLRAAHAAMDGDRIRELSAEQRRLIDDLAGEAFDAAGVKKAPAPLRDDVTGTLQAAIADPGVASRLGNLAKAERWSGFADFGDAAQVFTAAPAGKSTTEPKRAPQPPVKHESRDDTPELTRRERETARAALSAAERARAEADDALSERQADRAAARLAHDDARRRLREAERKLNAAEVAYDEAKQQSRAVAELVKEAKARLAALARGR
jgi:hypothetical protein